MVGLDHVDVPGSTMEPTAPPGETHKRIIDVGSAAGFCDAYPRGLPPTQCGERPDLGRHFQTVSQGPGMGYEIEWDYIDDNRMQPTEWHKKYW